MKKTKTRAHLLLMLALVLVTAGLLALGVYADESITAEDALTSANATTFGVWFLTGAALVFFMQAGFAMVETGFTRAKNAGNIIMKNLMDFCIGSVVFILLGFDLMMSETYIAGFIGLPQWNVFTNYANFNFSSFVFNLVFCATAATIVSGAMAERTKFSSYCIYSAVISLVVYPIEAGWVWNSQGWLAKLGYIDFAGSSAIHMVGGIAALIGAIIVGPRIGKYEYVPGTKKVATIHPIGGHNIPIGALGCFILWFGWYGFNGAACSTIEQFASVCMTTTLAPAFATVVCMLFTWIKDGKPDVGMCLNASLAGLVGVTAGCAQVDALGAIIIGCVSGIIVDLVVVGMDKLGIDDPVGAIAVHCANGIWGTLAVGLLATSSAPSPAEGETVDGLIYGIIHGNAAEGVKVFGVQCLGVLCIAAWTAVCMMVTFLVLKKVHGLRVKPEEEIAGMDPTEHGLASAYSGFTIEH